MKILACQFSKVSGPDAVSNYKIEFSVDESQRRGVQNLLTYKKGTSLLLMLFETENLSDENEVKEMTIENEKQTRIRFNKRMHALINEVAKEKGFEQAVIKKSLKKWLVSKKLIKESTAELDLKGLASAIYYLQNEYGLNEDYEEFN